MICTPHLGASTVEAQENVALQVAEQMANFLLHGAVSNAINMPSVSAEDAPKLRPYMKLAEQLGSFAGQLVEGNVKDIRIQYEGAVASLNIKPLTALVLAGFLKPSMEGVNIVSAPLKAKERGISLSEVTREKAVRYQTLIRISITTDAGESTISGTVIGDDMPRIIEIDGLPMETTVNKNMLYILNQDKPGLIGAVGTMLGNAGINIADFTLGRIPDKNTAIALITTDDPVSGKLLDDIAGIEQVERVEGLRF